MVVEIKDYTKVIKGNVVLDHVNYRFESGMIYGLKGKNGSGKTMLMRAITGLIHPTEGEVVIDGKVLGKDMGFPESVGLLLENPAFLPNETGFDNLKILAGIRNQISDQKISDILEEIGLDPKDKRTYRKYSLGMKQKLGIAAAIMEEPKLIILDEPINALDEEAVKKVKELILREKERGAVIIIACHDSEELNYLSDQIVPISGGKLLKQENQKGIGI